MVELTSDIYPPRKRDGDLLITGLDASLGTEYCLNLSVTHGTLLLSLNMSSLDRKLDNLLGA